MPAGVLRSRLTFSKRDATEDAYGNVQGDWVEQFTVPAQIRPRLGGETVEASRLAGRQPVIIRVRRSPDTKLIRTDWLATNVENGTQYNIRTAVDPDEGSSRHGMWVDMMADAGVAA